MPQNFFFDRRTQDNHVLEFDNWLNIMYLPVKENINQADNDALNEAKDAYKTSLQEAITLCGVKFKKSAAKFKYHKNKFLNTPGVSRCSIVTTNFSQLMNISVVLSNGGNYGTGLCLPWNRQVILREYLSALYGLVSL